MHPSQVTLLVVTAIVNICLWSEYAYMRPRASDFGAIQSNRVRVYTLSAAAVAYVCNLVFIGMVVAAPISKKMTRAHVDTITSATTVYYLLQLLFLPLVRASLKGATSKVWVQSLLLLCILPLAVIATVAMQTRSAALIALSLVSLLHATVNDAVLYGGSF